MCSCGSEPDTTAHFLLCCQNHKINRSKFLKNVYDLDQTLQNYDDGHLIHTLLYGSGKFNFNLNREIIKLTVRYRMIPNVLTKVSFEISWNYNSTRNSIQKKSLVIYATQLQVYGGRELTYFCCCCCCFCFDFFTFLFCSFCFSFHFVFILFSFCSFSLLKFFFIYFFFSFHFVF